MSTLFLDASALLAAFDADDELHGSARALLLDSQRTLASLDLIRYEVANVAVRAWKAPEQVPLLLEAIERIAGDGGVVPSTDALLASAARLAEEHGISVYDAAYVAAARQSGSTLVSCDFRDLIDKGLACSPPDAVCHR
ncbi:MAG TPA: PIN domain-containing protein [Solirubrobacteraceae bacterium]|nr:PIN domain-containing protein [Solirubrobacteraceae bacterium]